MAEPRPRRLLSLRVLFSVVGLIALIGGIAYLVLQRRTSSTATRTFEFVYPQRSTITATVNASGQIEPAQIANLTFLGTGRVNTVLVAVGQHVAAGTALATLDTQELQLRQSQAEASLLQAQANYDKLAAGATPDQVAASQAQVRQAQAQLRQASGSVTPADIAAAEAQLAQAQTQLASVQAGPQETDVRGAQAQFDQARTNVQAQRDNLSAAKTQAQLQLTQATNSLTQAQSAYATAKQNWDYVQDTGRDPVAPNTVNPQTGKKVGNTLNDSQRQQYYNAFVQAEAALRNAEDAVEQANVAYDNARQGEVSGIQVAEQQATSAQASLDKLTAGATNDQLATAQAAVRSAQANLDKLRGEQRRGTLDAAQAAVDSARSNLEDLQAGPAKSDLAVASAQVQNAQAALELAKLSLDQATLRAPFDGTISEINLRTGEVPSPSTASPPIVLADLSRYHIDVAVDEIDISRLQASQPVTLTLDALPGLALPGTVESIAPLASAQSSVTSYRVRVGVRTDDQRVRSGMSTTADIVVANKPNVLLLPRRAVRNERGQLIVEVPRDPSVCALPRAEQPTTIERDQRPVRTGLSNEQTIEITGGVDEQTCVYVEGVDARATLPFGRPGGGR